MNKEDPIKKWKIRIVGYGVFDFEGTEAEAEEIRRDKSRYERGVGTKWVADEKNTVTMAPGKD